MFEPVHKQTYFANCFFRLAFLCYFILLWQYIRTRPWINYYLHSYKKTSLSMMTVFPASYGCPTGWKQRGRLCFKVKTTPKDWSSARADCQQMPGADLAAITNSDMQGFVNSMFHLVPLVQL